MEKLFKISLILSVIGISFLLLLSNLLEPKLIKIKEVNDKMINQKVKIQGEVSSIRTYKDSNFQILSLKDETGEIDVTLNEKTNITKNQTIIVIGKVTEYQKELQITADKILRR